MIGGVGRLRQAGRAGSPGCARTCCITALLCQSGVRPNLNPFWLPKQNRSNTKTSDGGPGHAFPVPDGGAAKNPPLAWAWTILPRLRPLDMGVRTRAATHAACTTCHGSPNRTKLQQLIWHGCAGPIWPTGNPHRYTKSIHADPCADANALAEKNLPGPPRAAPHMKRTRCHESNFAKARLNAQTTMNCQTRPLPIQHTTAIANRRQAKDTTSPAPS